MEEVDKILILTLNQLGCELDEDVVGVGQLGVGEVVRGAALCVRAITGATSLPTSLPQNMAQRFRTSAAIAQAVKECGYPGDVGYQSLLYPSEAEVRTIFMFLIDKLPKDTTAVSSEPMDKLALIHHEARAKARVALGQAWVPPHCRRVVRRVSLHAPVTTHGTHHAAPFTARPYTHLATTTPQELAGHYERQGRTAGEVVGQRYLLASLLAAHALMLEKERLGPPAHQQSEVREALEVRFGQRGAATPEPRGDLTPPVSAFTTTQMLQDKRSSSDGKVVGTSEEEVLRAREARVAALQAELAGLQEDITAATQAAHHAHTTLAQVMERVALEEKCRDERAAELKMKRRVANLVPDSQANAQRLKEALASSGDKMARLQQQWDAHRAPLDQQLHQLTLDITNNKSSREEVLGEMAGLREKMRAMCEDAARKEAMVAQLKTQLQNMNQDINRSAYTKRILDMSGKVRRQKDEIGRVLSDTRAVQKEINTLSGKLGRTFTVVEGTAYKEAGGNEKVRQVYRGVLAVHEGCGALVDLARDTGALQRDLVDLQQQVDLEKSKKVEENLRKVEEDLSQVKQLNATLKQQLV